MKKWFNKKEIVISKREMYNNRVTAAIILVVVGIVIMILAVIQTSVGLKVGLSIVGFAIIIVGVVIISFLYVVGIFYLEEVVEKGTVFYKLYIHKNKFGLRDPKPEKRLFESFSDAESYVEHGPDWDKNEP